MGPMKHVLSLHGCTLAPPVCSGDAAFLSNYFDHLLLLGHIARTTYVDAAYYHRLSSVICLSFGLSQ